MILLLPLKQTSAKKEEGKVVGASVEYIISQRKNSSLSKERKSIAEFFISNMQTIGSMRSPYIAHNASDILAPVDIIRLSSSSSLCVFHPKQHT